METRKLKQQDGTIAVYLDMGDKKILHNWEGAALIPQGNKKLAEYYLHGVKYPYLEWKELRKERNGVPFYKNPAFRGDHRN